MTESGGIGAAVKHIAIDLFCGAGGMSLGFERAGFDIRVAVDLDPVHAATYEVNFPHAEVLVRDIAGLSGSEILPYLPSGRGIDVVFGGSPCQGFSVIGKRAADDPRNAMVHEFVRLVVELQPRYVVWENVPGFLAPTFESTREEAFGSLEDAGYRIVRPLKLLHANEFGIPQRRKRFFILAFKNGQPPLRYPEPACSRPCPTVEDAISDLRVVDTNLENVVGDRYFGELGTPSLYAMSLRAYHESRTPAQGLGGNRRTVHSAAVVARFARTTPGMREPVSHFERLQATGTSGTLRAGTALAQGKFTAPRPIHYGLPRCITVREAARLQSFPDWFEFNHTIWHGFRQVGNSVPPLLAKAVADQVASMLNGAASQVMTGAST